MFSLTAVSFRSGKIDNITALNGVGLFACEKITFAEPFPSGKQVKVFASPSNLSTGPALWAKSEDKSQFSACTYEYSDGSNSIEINWIALQSAPSGVQIGTTSLDSWTTGTECKKIYFPQVSCAIFFLSFFINNLKSFVIHNFKGHNISLSRCAPLLSFQYTM